MSSASNRWIFNVENNQKEFVLFQNERFVLCRDLPRSCDDENGKLLIIYKDQNLRTIRDLRQQHISVLQESMSTALKFACLSNNKISWTVYFNYFPSNYQLHAHVVQCSDNVHLRSHKLKNVIQNLMRDDSYYVKALLFTRISRSNAVFPVYQANMTESSFKLIEMMQKRGGESKRPAADKQSSSELE